MTFAIPARRGVLAYAVAAAFSPPLHAQPVGYDELAAIQAAANARAGARTVPARVIPVPTDGVSPEAQKLIGNPYLPFFNADPKTPAEWKELIEVRVKSTAAAVPAMKEKFGVNAQPTVIGGVKSFIVTPRTIPVSNRDRLLVHLHGGGYVLAHGEAVLPEAILMAGIGGFKVISVDFRTPPDFPYPAAMDDAMAVWKDAVKMAKPENMAIFGQSSGGEMTLAMVLRAKAEKLPLPAAIAPSTPLADINKTSDSYETNEWIDNVLVTWDGFFSRAVKLYAGGHDLKDPQLSPIYGDFSGFPPAILTTGTRDLFLSNTVRVHRKLRRAGVEADLNVYEGMSHGQYAADMNAPETREAFTDIANFFDKHLGN
jgi:monoterpene epsilon-lactone hydrolase